LGAKITAQIGAHISPDVVARLDEYSSRSGKRKNEIVETALKRYLDEQDPGH
jgi:predicted DNA-binding protein